MPWEGSMNKMECIIVLGNHCAGRYCVLLFDRGDALESALVSTHRVSYFVALLNLLIRLSFS